MSFWSAEHVRGVLGGTWLARPRDQAASGGVGVDTRTLQAGQMFVALRGEKVDGHDYLNEAAARGAWMALVEDGARASAKGLPAGLGVLLVGDTRRALGKLAAAYRGTLEGTRVIAVTGSNGKTTTVRLIDAVLGAGGGLKGTASVKSFNNDIGVPLTVLRARRGDQYLICEVGTNHPGEIAALGAIVKPDVAVITSIGREHLEFLGSVRGVCREESSILGCLKSGGLGVVTADCAELEEFIKGRPVVRFGMSERADVRVMEVEQGLEGVRFVLNDRGVFRVPMVGAHNASNAAAAVAVGRRLRVSDERIAAGLAAAQGPEMRLERVRVELAGGAGVGAGAGGVEVLNDAYNANPDSMLAAVRTLMEVGRDAGRRVVVLGDMLELGEASAASHREVAEAVAQSAADAAVLVGEAWREPAEEVRRAWSGSGRTVEWMGSVDGGGSERAAGLVRGGDVVLIKGSRRMGLERVAKAIVSRGVASR